MTARRVHVLLVLLLAVNAAISQTFQYSRGWTNGKRSSEFPGAADIAGNPLDERFTNGDLKRLRMLVHGNTDEQPLLFHCDFVDRQRKLVHADNCWPRLHHEKDQNDDNDD